MGGQRRKERELILSKRKTELLCLAKKIHELRNKKRHINANYIRNHKKYCKKENAYNNQFVEYQDNLMISLRKVSLELNYFLNVYNYKYDNFVLLLNEYVMYDIIENK